LFRFAFSFCRFLAALFIFEDFYNRLFMRDFPRILHRPGSMHAEHLSVPIFS
jgi:hypothetical protein